MNKHFSEFWFRNVVGVRSLDGLRPEELYGDNLKYALDMLGISQVEFSRMTGIAESTISRYVNGSRIPDTRNAFMMLNTLWKAIEDRGYGDRMR